MKTTKSFRLSEQTLRKLDILSKRYNMNVTEIIESAVGYIYDESNRADSGEDLHAKTRLWIAGF